jgi:hypothetical protein
MGVEMRHHHSLVLCLAPASSGVALAETPAAIEEGFARDASVEQAERFDHAKASLQVPGGRAR